jgi:hypothetical protein
MHGGGQERGFRSGTEITPMIVGLGEACATLRVDSCPYYRISCGKPATFFPSFGPQLFWRTVLVHLQILSRMFEFFT